MKLKCTLATGMLLILYSAFAHAYSQEEVNRVELPRDDAVQAEGANTQSQIQRTAVEFELLDNKSTINSIGTKSPSPISTTPPVDVP